MIVRVDSQVCEGYGACARHLPTVFVLDEWGYASVADGGGVTAADEAAAQRAIFDCPVHAISDLAHRHGG